MADQLALDFDQLGMPDPFPPERQPLLELAYRILGMQVAEALVHIEEIVDKAQSKGDAEIASLAQIALRKLEAADDPWNAHLVARSCVGPRARKLGMESTYG